MPSDSEMAAVYAEIVTAIAPFSDVLLIETMSCVRESVAAAKAATVRAPVCVCVRVGVR